MKISNIGIISPSTPLDNRAEVEQAVAHLHKFGVECQFFEAQNKLDEFYQAQNSGVDLIMATRGGFDAVELLPKIDFAKINKSLCGYSDITVLLNAMLAQTGKVQFLGPNLKALNNDIDNYMISNWLRVVEGETEINYQPAISYRDMHSAPDEDQPNRKIAVFNEGEASGYLVGGNLCSQIMLCGTKYYPVYDEMIVVAEEDDLCSEYTVNMFLRNLWALCQYDFVKNIKGLIIGRFMDKSKVNLLYLKEKLKELEPLAKIPVVANFDTGHTMPMMTLPLGKKAVLNTKKANILSW